MRPNIPTMIQTDWFETSHADLRLAAIIGEAPKPKSNLPEYGSAFCMAELESTLAAITAETMSEMFAIARAAQPQTKAAEYYCPICLITPLEGSYCRKCAHCPAPTHPLDRDNFPA